MQQEHSIKITQHEKRYRRILLLVVASAFGPYLLPNVGLRTDHVVILGLAALTLLSAVPRRSSASKSPSLWLLLIIQATYTTLVCAVTWLADYPKVSSNLILADFQHCIQIMAIVWLVVYACQPMGHIALKRTLRSICILTCLILAANSVLSMMQMFWDMRPITEPFIRVTADGALEQSVWHRAGQIGRYCGMINQPFESGVSYAVGFLSWIYCFANEKKLIYNYCLLILILLGGFLAVSKVFIFGGFPIGLVFWIQSTRKNAALIWKFIAVFSIAFVIASILLAEWTGWSHFFRSTSIDGSFYEVLSNLTAGRYGHEDQTIMLQVANWWDQSPLFGFGLGYQRTFDSGYLEAVIKLGLIGLLLQTSIIAVICAAARKSFWYGNRAEFLFLRWLCFLVIGANLGAPILIINRASVPLWVLICLCILIGERGRFKKVVIDSFCIDNASNQIHHQILRRLAY